ncbi:MAG: STAS domain-containing protein [Phycisphaerae bacterium]|nr:STAS domain-containing protein [Phycisphaerae bacterium]
MKVQTDIRDDLAILAVAGELNADSVAKFGEAVEQAHTQAARDFIVDLSEVTSVDSAGLECLVRLQREAEEQLGMVQFCGADQTLSKIFEMTRLDKRFTLHPSVDAAIASFAPAG